MVFEIVATVAVVSFVADVMLFVYRNVFKKAKNVKTAA